MKKKRVAVLISGGGSNMAKLIEACRRPAFPAEIVLVLANKDAPGLRLAQAAGIPVKYRTWVYPDQEPDQQARFEGWAIDEITAADVELICCAGFMRLLSGAFVERFENRILNIHPSLLPAFPGLNTHKRALAEGARFAGCTVHFMRQQMDTGPIVAQAVTRILPGDTIETLADRILPLEHQIYPKALELVAGDKIAFSGNRVDILDQPDPPAIAHLIDPAPIYQRPERRPFPPALHDDPIELDVRDDQKMPRSVGLTLRAMRLMADLTVDDMAEQLSNNIGRFNPANKEFSYSTVSSLELAQTGTSNWHLETYQNWSYIATSCIDLIAHLGADLRDGNVAAARALARTVKRFCNEVEQHAEAMRTKAIHADLDPDYAASYDTFHEACMRSIRAGDTATDEQRTQTKKDVLMLLLAEQMIELLQQQQTRPLRKIYAKPKSIP